MMEYTSKYWNMLTPLIKKSLLKRYGKEETAELLRKTNQIYRDMLRRADDIGKDNPMASNLYEGLIFLALWDASDRKISVDELRTISEEMMSFPLLKAMGLMINANKKKKSIQATGATFTWGANSFADLGNIAAGFRKVKDDNIARGMETLNPIYKLVMWMPIVHKFAEKILVFEKA